MERSEEALPKAEPGAGRFVKRQGQILKMVQ